MAIKNKDRTSCVDVFNAFLVENANYDGMFEIPKIKTSKNIPNRVISFSKCIKSNDYDQWVHFYEDDIAFERIWNNPKRYLHILKKYRGVILPDFSLYRDMPLVMQIWNIYRSRAIGNWLQENGIEIIPNIRYGDSRTYGISCCGIELHKTIAVGSNGTYKHKEDKKIFCEGLYYVVKLLEPKNIIVYGSISKEIIELCKKRGIQVIQFESDVALSHKEVE